MDSPESSHRLSTEVLAGGDGFQVVSTRWSRPRHPSESHDCLPYAAIEFMQSGSFRKHVRGRTVVGDPNTVVFFNPDEPFGVLHPHGHQNRGVTIRLFGDFFTEACSEFPNPGGRFVERLSSKTHAVTSPSLHLRLHRLVRGLIRAAPGDPLEVEESVLGIVHESLGVMFAPQFRAPDRSPRRTSVSADRRLVAAIEYLGEHFARKLTLQELGRATGCSSWRICRVFSDGVGIPVHRYLSRLRLREALARMSDGEVDLTQVALAAGFGSHSHFTAAFRREFGATPRAVRGAYG